MCTCALEKHRLPAPSENQRIFDAVKWLPVVCTLSFACPFTRSSADLWNFTSPSNVNRHSFDAEAATAPGLSEVSEAPSFGTTGSEAPFKSSAMIARRELAEGEGPALATHAEAGFGVGAGFAAAADDEDEALKVAKNLTRFSHPIFHK